MVINTLSGTRSQQKGVTLITVMIILIIVTLLGISAMRMSLTSLTLATNSQVTNLLFQSADVGLVQFANEVNRTPGVADKAGGILEDAVSTEGTEFSFCLTPKASTAKKFIKGNCDVTVSANYMSGRDVVATQVTIKVVKNTDYILGTDSTLAGPLVPIKLNVYSTAVLPAFGSATKSKINECLGKLNDDSADATAATPIVSTTDCLTDEGAVFNTQIDEVTYGYKF